MNRLPFFMYAEYFYVLRERIFIVFRNAKTLIAEALDNSPNFKAEMQNEMIYFSSFGIFIFIVAFG